MFSRNLIEYGLQQFVRKSGEIAWKQTRTLAGYATCSCTRSRSKSLADNACKTLKTPASRLYIGKFGLSLLLSFGPVRIIKK